MALRLFALVLIPLIAVQLVVLRRVANQQAVADSAGRLTAPLQRFDALASLLGSAAVEETVSVSIATADSYAIDRKMLASLVGIDLEAVLETARDEVDAAFENLIAGFGTEELGSGKLASEVFAAHEQDIRDLRTALDSRRSSTDQIRAVFTEISASATTGIETTASNFSDMAESDSTQRLFAEHVSHLMHLHGSSVAEARAVSIGLAISPVNDEPILAIAAAGQADAASHEYGKILEGGPLGGWAAWRQSAEIDRYRSMRPELWRVLAERATSANDPRVDPSRSAFLGQVIGASVAGLQSLNDYSSSELSRYSVEAETYRASTRQQLTGWFAALGVVTLGSLALLAFTLRSITLPLRRLTDRAEELVNGQVSREPLPISGPNDLRTVTESFNALTSTLAAYEHELNNVASGVRPDATGAVEMPGALGRSMRESIRLSRRDLLTGLPNRLAAMERVDSLLASNHQVGVVLIDLDSFKRLNEGRGFGTGDLVLAEVSRRLQAAIRDGEFVARLGSDEFLVVAQSVSDTAMALRIADRLLTEVGQPYEFEGSLIGLSAAAGVAIGLHASDARELVREAEVALHRAKAQGRGRVEMFSSELQEQVEELSIVEAALRGAVEREEFELFLQPVLELETGLLWGAEALVRWNRPGFGTLSPASFLSIAEDCGVTVDLERWVMAESVRILATWQLRRSTASLNLAVNVSGRHLLEGDLIAVLDEAAARTGVDLKHLEIELTETALLADFERAADILGAVRERGVQVAVDDFGTGYSSMNYLGSLPVDTIKIDRLFVARAGKSGYDRSILEIIVQLGQLLNLSVVAEGVEDADQLAFLEARGCDRAQGYLISHPLPEPEFARWVDNGSWRVETASAVGSLAALPQGGQ